MKGIASTLPLSITLIALLVVSMAVAEDFYGKHLPPSVAIGMSLAELRAARPNAIENKLRRPGDAAADRLEMIELRRDTDAPAAFGYRFEAGKLASVTKATKTIGMPVAHTEAAVSALAEELKGVFALKSREEIVRSSGSATAVLTAQLWEDTASGLNLYLVATNQEREVIIFNPRVFRKADFFVGPEMLEKVKRNNERIGATLKEPAATPVPLIDLLAKIKAGSPAQVTPNEQLPTPTAPTPVPTATPNTSSAPSNPVAQTPAPVVKPKPPVWPWLVGIAALIAIIVIALKRRA